MLVLALICFIVATACFAGVAAIEHRKRTALVGELRRSTGRIFQYQRDIHDLTSGLDRTTAILDATTNVAMDYERRTLRFSVEEQMALDGVPIPEPHPWPRPIKPFALDSRHALDLEG